MREGTYFDIESGFAFHSTTVKNIHSIRQNGIECSRSCNVDSDSIMEVLQNSGSENYSERIPFDREQVVYAHPDTEFVQSLLQGMEENEQKSERVFFVIDVDKVTAPMYVGSLSLMSDLLDYRFAGPEQMMFSDSVEDAVTQYCETLHPVSCTDDLVEARKKFEQKDVGGTELIIDGDVPSDAIVDLLGHEL